MTNHELISSRIYDMNRLNLALAVWRFQQKKIVFTNGCFDIIHPGHVEYLAKASDLGDVLILGLNSDASVRQLKGNNRPVINENGRAQVLASLHFVDAVVFFDDLTPAALIEIVQPDVLVKGKDYKAEDIVGYNTVMAKGGCVETIELVEGYSTSLIIQKIKQSY